jgi:hypothetical protein
VEYQYDLRKQLLQLPPNVIRANRSRIRHRDHGLGTSRQYERGVNFGHAAGLIDRIVDYSGVFKNTEPAGCWVVQPSL